MELPKGFSLNPLLRASYVIDPADHAAGIADRDAVFRNILCDDASRSDHAPSSNSYARQEDGTSANPATVPDRHWKRLCPAKIFAALRVPIGRQALLQLHRMCRCINLHI